MKPAISKVNYLHEALANVLDDGPENKKYFEKQKFDEQPTSKQSSGIRAKEEETKNNRHTHTYRPEMKIINGENKHTLTEYQIISKFQVNTK